MSNEFALEMASKIITTSLEIIKTAKPILYKTKAASLNLVESDLLYNSNHQHINTYN